MCRYPANDTRYELAFSQSVGLASEDGVPYLESPFNYSVRSLP